MTSGLSKRATPLTLVRETAASRDATDNGSDSGSHRDLDWSILMAHAQAGDGAAYRRLLREIAPHLRSEPRRDCRRLQALRGWSHGYEEEDIEQIFT
ncbi:hypothetical protein [Methylosinus sp. H3A]|uniref:hypothetical protein n=1 Tax=Methylosinus sp. H3A TaxID=2785786 RepID=UPI00289BDC47|nr:hypothetical protein [Methylosinus sp. H3A]